MSKDATHDAGHQNKQLVGLIATILHDFLGKVVCTLEKLNGRLETAEATTQQNHNNTMTALESLTAAVNENTQGQSNLTTAVNAAIVQLGKDTPTDVQLQSLQTAIESNTQSDKALTESLLAAVGPVTTPVGV